jgi:hypothetical protein
MCIINIYNKTIKNIFRLPKKIFLVILCGIFNALMSISFIYSANPERTPVIIQSIFLGLVIFPTVLFRKILLKKEIKYNIKFIIPSVILLIISVIIACIPLLSFIKNNNLKNFVWIIGYMLAIFLMSIDNTMQEKYIMESGDNTISNKIKLAFYTSLFQIITLVCFFWVEYLFGYTNNPIKSFKNSFISFFESFRKIIILQLFIWDCLLLYLFSILLNAYSTNYNMILTNLTNQSVAIFFSIFSNLNNGIKAPLYITIPSLVLNIISVILWVPGEKNREKNELSDNRELHNLNVFN